MDGVAAPLVNVTDVPVPNAVLFTVGAFPPGEGSAPLKVNVFPPV